MDKLFTLIFVCVLIILGIISVSTVEIKIYEYIDLDGNKGFASKCSSHYSGGNGSTVCILEDGTVIMVKQYKLIDYKQCKMWEKDCV